MLERWGQNMWCWDRRRREGRTLQERQQQFAAAGGVYRVTGNLVGVAGWVEPAAG